MQTKELQANQDEIVAQIVEIDTQKAENAKLKLEIEALQKENQTQRDEIQA